MASIDPTKIKAMPVQKTLLAVNNFVVNTAAFLNNFSNTCEHKVARITARVTDLETLLAVLEAKLQSIPLDPATASAAAAAADTAAAATAPPPPAVAPSSSTPTAATPASAAAAAPSTLPPPPPVAAAAAAVATAAAGPLIKDHPDYEPFFKMLKVGLPPFVVQAKMTAAGLDPTYLDRGEEPMPSSAGGNTPAAPAPQQPSPAPANISSGASVASTALPPPSSSSSSSVPSSSSSVAAASVAGASPPPPPPPPASTGGPLIKDHPDYEPFFKMLKVGLPPFVVQAKMTAAGLDPSYLDRGEDTMPTSHAPSSSSSSAAPAPAPVPAPAPAVVAAPASAAEAEAPIITSSSSSSSGGVKVKDHPDYEPFFKMLKVGLPPFVVQAKMTAAGLDPTYLDRGEDTI